MKNENKIKLSSKYVIYISIIIFLLSASIIIYCFKDDIINKFNYIYLKNKSINIIQNDNKDILKKSDYIYLKDRVNYIIQTADENFLNNYYGNDNTMVVFSASWCKYCVEEQNELNNFINNNPEKKVLVVSHDKTYEDLDKYLKDNNLNWFVIFDKDKTIRQNIDPDVNGIPSTYLLNKNGKIIGYSKGVKTETEFLQFYNNEINIY